MKVTTQEPVKVERKKDPSAGEVYLSQSGNHYFVISDKQYVDLGRTSPYYLSVYPYVPADFKNLEKLPTGTLVTFEAL